MATFTGTLYGQFPLHLALKRINWDTDDIRLLLLASTYALNQDTHAFESSLTGELATAGGYTAGGIAVANTTVTYDAATNITKLDCDDVVISNSTLTWRTAVFSDKTPASAATNPLIAANVGDSDTVSTGGATTITMPAAGVVTLTV